MENSALQRIRDKPKIFFKKLYKYWPNELLFSKDIPNLRLLQEHGVADEIFNFSEKIKPRIELFNTYTCLEKHYPFENYDYEGSYLDAAKEILVEFDYDIKNFMDRKRRKESITKELPRHLSLDCDKVDAFREQVARGFIPRRCSPFDTQTNYYIYSHVCDLIYPVAWDCQTDAFPTFNDIGIKGHNGIYTPKTK